MCLLSKNNIHFMDSFYLRKIIRTIKSEGYSGLFTKLRRKLRRFFDKEKDMNSVASHDDYYDFTNEDLRRNRELLEKSYQKDNYKLSVVNWFIPSFSHPMGGLLSIFKFTRFLQSKGIVNRFVIYNKMYSGEKEECENAFRISAPDIFDKKNIFYSYENIESIPACDAAIATRWDSAFAVLKFNKTKAKFYFVQDFEPLFYPAGFKYALAEATYRFGFGGLVSSYGLYEEYKKYTKNAAYFNPAVDRKIYYPKNDTNSPESKALRIVFYGRPGSQRNGFHLGIDALTLIKKKYGNKVQILSVGEDWSEKSFHVDGIIKNLGLLKSLDAVADLYRSADIGLCFVFTKHPSFQPLEFMASGVPVVTNYNVANTWLFRNGENILLAEPSRSCVFEALAMLIDDKALRGKLAKEGLLTMEKFDWDREFERIFNFMQGSR